jgi:hypothetical protein
MKSAIDNSLFLTDRSIGLSVSCSHSDRNPNPSMVTIKKNKLNSQCLVLILSVTMLAGGCRSNDDYSKLGMAGAKYIEAVDLLLDEAVQTRINLTSENILSSDRGSKSTGISTDEYEQFSIPDRKKIQDINRLKGHNSLLSRYFTLLKELATSDAPQKAQTEITTVAKDLTTLGNEISGSSSSAPSSLLGSSVNFIVRLQIREALKQELEKRGKLIDNALKIQEEELQRIGKVLLREKGEIAKRQEQRLVIRLITTPTPIGNEEGWIETRRKIYIINVTSEQFSIASSALNDFRKVFQSSLEGKSDLAGINNFLSEVEIFTQLVKDNK